MTIQPLADRVVLKPCELEETNKGRHHPCRVCTGKTPVAEVVAVGPGGTVDGNEVKMYFKVGDKGNFEQIFG